MGFLKAVFFGRGPTQNDFRAWIHGGSNGWVMGFLPEPGGTGPTETRRGKKSQNNVENPLKTHENPW